VKIRVIRGQLLFEILSLEACFGFILYLLRARPWQNKKSKISGEHAGDKKNKEKTISA